MQQQMINVQLQLTDSEEEVGNKIKDSDDVRSEHSYKS